MAMACVQGTFSSSALAGGRPRKTFGEGPSVALKSGISLQAEEDGKGWLIRLSGKRVDRELVETTMRELEALLSSNLR